MHEAIRNQPGNKNTIFQLVPMETQVSDELLTTFVPVDITHLKHHIKILCKSSINHHGTKSNDPICNKYSLYRTLPKSLRRVCGKISLPPDGGQKLMEYVKERECSLIGVSDASVIETNGTHAWILTTGEKDYINDPYMKLEGSGPIDGDKQAISSARGELQGQTALAIITEALLMEHEATDIPVTFFTDNQGIKKCCGTQRLIE
jgi:hypothetical protein